MATPLMNWIEGLLRDPDARTAFLDDPGRYAEDHGFHAISSADVHDALSLIADADHSNFSHGVHYPAPRHSHHHGDADGAHYLHSYFREHHKAIERHSADLDNSVHQDIGTHAHGYHHHYYYDDAGDFQQVEFTQHADRDPVVGSGDGAVSTGGSISDDTVTSGDGNVVGQGDQAVTGHHNATAFGTGDATGGSLRAAHGDGGALGVRTDAVDYGEDDDTSTRVHNSGAGDTSVNSAGDHGYADQHTDQTYHDNSIRTDYEDATRTDTHEHTNSHNDTRYHDSHDTIDVTH